MSLPEPYYDRDGVTIYCGDSWYLSRLLPAAAAIVTDPVWPNAWEGFQLNGCTPRQILGEVLYHMTAERVVIQIGCNSDPRFLDAVPDRWPFLRACWLEYARPHYLGRLLYTSDMAYAFGTWPASQEGMHVTPGKVMDTTFNGKQTDHPTPRKLAHVKWLLKWFGRGLVIDPFMGSGTTALAAKEMGLPFIGVEIEERYCAMTVERLRQGVFAL